MSIAKNPKRLTIEEHQAGAFISGATKPVRRNKIMCSPGWHTATRGRRARSSACCAMCSMPG